MSLRVALGEDSYLAREGISRVLEAADDIEIVATCADYETLRAAVGETEPDVVLTDIRMPPTHTDEGIRLAEELRGTHPESGWCPQPVRRAAVRDELLEHGSGRPGVPPEGAGRRPRRARPRDPRGGVGRSVIDPKIVDALIASARGRRGLAASAASRPGSEEILALSRGRQEQQAIADSPRDHEARGREATSTRSSGSSTSATRRT